MGSSSINPFHVSLGYWIIRYRRSLILQKKRGNYSKACIQNLMDPGFVQRWLKWFYEQGDVSTPAKKKRAYGRHDKAPF